MAGVTTLRTCEFVWRTGMPTDEEPSERIENKESWRDVCKDAKDPEMASWSMRFARTPASLLSKRDAMDSASLSNGQVRERMLANTLRCSLPMCGRSLM